jgi:restriction endonuclease S subunit
MVKLGDVCDVRDGTYDSPQYVSEGYPLIISKKLRNGSIDFSDTNLISRKDLDTINKRSKVDDGDILMPMIGTIGNPVIADKFQEYGIKNVTLIKIYKNSKIINRYLNISYLSIEMQSHFERQSFGSTRKFIPLGFIRELQIPYRRLRFNRKFSLKLKNIRKPLTERSRWWRTGSRILTLILIGS